MPGAGVREENVSSGEFSNVMVLSMPRAAIAASKLAAAVVELGAVARELAPSSAPVNRTRPACAGDVTKARASVSKPTMAVLLGICIYTMIGLLNSLRGGVPDQ